MTLPEADEIVRIAEGAHIKIALAYYCRYDLPYLVMKQMIEAREIGEPVAIHGRGKNHHRGGGEDLITLGTHVLDLETFLFGQPEYGFADVTANGRPIARSDVNRDIVEPIGPAAGEDVYACFRFPGGVRGLFESRHGLSQDAPASHMGITVTGTGGSLSIRFEDGVAEPCRPYASTAWPARPRTSLSTRSFPSPSSAPSPARRRWSTSSAANQISHAHGSSWRATATPSGTSCSPLWRTAGPCPVCTPPAPRSR